MVFTVAVLLLALAGNSLLLARGAARRRAYRRLWANVAMGLLLLGGAAAVVRYGLWNPAAFMPAPTSNCTYGLGGGAHVCVSPIRKSPLHMKGEHDGASEGLTNKSPDRSQIK